MNDAYIFDAIRTPRGKGRAGGALNGCSPLVLLKTLIEELVQRHQLNSKAVDDLILGCVTQIGEQGGNIAKVAALFSGLPSSVSGITLNRYCTSGLDACNFAAMKVMTNSDQLILAGGVESMSRVPMLSDQASFYSEPEIVKTTGFVPMGLAADLIATVDGISREECDAYAVESQQRAARAQKRGAFARSLVPVTDPVTKQITEIDESVRGNLTEKDLAKYEPLFTELGSQGYEQNFKAHFSAFTDMQYVHHIGNSPGIVDGASLVAIGSQVAGADLDLRPRARIVAMSNVCSDEMLALTGGIEAAADVLEKAGMCASDIDLVEFNEAFASTSVKFLRQAGWDADQVNVNGGAISIGHAMGATGASLLGIVLDELESRDLSAGLIAVSGAAGIGTATIIERV